MRMLTREEIDKLATLYPCLDLSIVDDYKSEIETLLEVQFQACAKDEADTLEAIIMDPAMDAVDKVYEIKDHITELRQAGEAK